MDEVDVTARPNVPCTTGDAIEPSGVAVLTRALATRTAPEGVPGGVDSNRAKKQAMDEEDDREQTVAFLISSPPHTG